MTGVAIAPASSKLAAASLAGNLIDISGLNALLTRTV